VEGERKMGGPTVQVRRQSDSASKLRDGTHIRDYYFGTYVAYARTVMLPPYTSLLVNDFGSEDIQEHYMYITEGHLLVRQGAPGESDDFYEVFAGDMLRAVEMSYELANISSKPALVFQVVLNPDQSLIPLTE
jgi:hypothetical protein